MTMVLPAPVGAENEIAWGLLTEAFDLAALNLIRSSASACSWKSNNPTFTDRYPSTAIR